MTADTLPSTQTPVPHTAISRRWRAQTFSQIVGQTAAVETLRNAVRLGRVGHAYLFVGPRGTGKTSMARILAKAVNCATPTDGEPCDACQSCVAIREGAALDVAEFDAASNNTVNDMRELLPRVHTAPADLRRKVFIVDEVQRIKEGWDVLLKTLEEPPPHVLFVFCTTDQSQIRPAVVSRVQRFTFRPLTVPEITGKLERILAADSRIVEPDAIRLVAELAAGGMRDAESMLDQLLSSSPERLTADDVRAQLGLATSMDVDALLGALLSGDALAGVRVLDRLESEGRDLRLAVDQAVERLRHVLLRRLAGDPVPEAFAALQLREIVTAARGLASIDPARAGGGGVRLQIELLLLAPVTTDIATRVPADDHRSAPTGAFHAAPRPLPRPDEPRPVRSEPSSRAGEPGSRGTPGEVPSPPASAPRRQRPPTAPPESEARAARTARRDAVEEGPRSGRAPDDLIEKVRSGWPAIVAGLSKPSLKPLVEACRPVRTDGRTVVLGFPEDKAFLREKAEQRHAEFEAAIAGVVGMEVGVRCVATNLEALPPLPHEAIGRENLAAARRVFAGDLADASDVD